MTLTELMVSLAMMSVLLVAVVRFVGGTRISLNKQEVNAELLTRSTRIGANLRASIGSARLLMPDYGGAPDFSAYRAWVRSSIAASPATPPPAPFSLPALVSNYRSAPLYSVSASAQAIWGDELLFLASLRPLTLTVKYGPGATDNAQTLSLDRVQFVYLYPALVKLGVGGQSEALRLTEWRSQPFVLYDSIKESTNTVTAPRLSKTCEALAGLGYTWALNMDKIATPAEAWYRVRVPGGLPMLELDASGPTSAPQSNWAYVDDFEYVADFLPRPGRDLGRVSRGGGGMASSDGRYVLAFNTVDPTVNPAHKTVALLGPGKRYTVPAHARADRDGQVGFPGGFEVAVVGRPLAREVVLRHVMMGVAATEPGSPSGSRRASEGLEFVGVKNDY